MFKNTLPLALAFIFVALPASAMNWANCKEYFNDMTIDTYSSLGRDFMSTSQFTSSWGQCSAIGRLEQRRDFFVANSEQVKVDCARGQGEYVEALASLSGCNDTKSISLFAENAKKNFERIFGPSGAAPSLEIVDKMIEANIELREACQVSKASTVAIGNSDH